MVWTSFSLGICSAAGTITRLLIVFLNSAPLPVFTPEDSQECVSAHRHPQWLRSPVGKPFPLRSSGNPKHVDPENEGWGGGSGYCSAKSPEGNEWTAGLGKWSDGVDLVAGEQGRCMTPRTWVVQMRGRGDCPDLAHAC